MAIKINFQNVGRGNASWEVTVNELNEADLARLVQKRKVLASRFIDVYVEEAETEFEVGKGTIYAGDRCVGSFTFETIE